MRPTVVSATIRHAEYVPNPATYVSRSFGVQEQEHQKRFQLEPSRVLQPFDFRYWEEEQPHDAHAGVRVSSGARPVPIALATRHCRVPSTVPNAYPAASSSGSPGKEG